MGEREGQMSKNRVRERKGRGKDRGSNEGRNSHTVHVHMSTKVRGPRFNPGWLLVFLKYAQAFSLYTCIYTEEFVHVNVQCKSNLRER